MSPTIYQDDLPSDSATLLFQAILWLPIAHRIKAKLDCLASCTSSTAWDNAGSLPNPCAFILFT